MQKNRNRQKSLSHKGRSQTKDTLATKEKHEKLTLEVQSLATDGRGVAHDTNGIVVFVQGLLPQESAKVEIITQKSSYKNAVMVKLEHSSPERASPPCIYYGQCGGCQLQHIASQFQTKYKTQWFFETLRRIGKWNEDHITVAEKNIKVQALKHENYRRRVRFHFDGKSLGFRRASSHNIVDIKHCLIASKKINERIETFKLNLMTFYNDILEKKLAKKIECEIELTETDDDRIVFHISNFVLDKQENIQSCKALLEKKLGIQSEQLISIKHPNIAHFKLKKQSFIQPHQDCLQYYCEFITEQVHLYFQRIVNIQNKKDLYTAIDLYAGSGVFSPLAHTVGEQLGLKVNSLSVEGIEESIESLKSNLKNVPHEACHQRVEDFIDLKFAQKIENTKAFSPVDIFILDPPRTGVGLLTMQKLVELCSEKALVVYVSCDSASFARDCRLLLNAGFYIKNVSLFDAFGHTIHYEVICAFER